MKGTIVPALRHYRSEAIALEEWFGVGADLVKPLPRMVWFISREDEGGPPEWLRNSPHILRFPRYTPLVKGRRVPIPGIMFPELARRVRWIVENQMGEWRMVPQDGSAKTAGIAFRAIIFAKDRDAVHYTLRFGRTCLTTV